MKVFRITTLVILTLAAALFFSLSTAIAQEPSEGEAQEQTLPIDALNRETPQGSVKGLLNAISRDDIEQAVEYFDFRSSSMSETKQRAFVTTFIELMNNHGTLEALNVISSNPQGNLQDGNPSDQELIGQIKVMEKTIPVILVKTANEESGVNLWLVGPQTIREAASLEKTSTQALINQWLPEDMVQTKWRGAPIGHWMSMVGMLVMAYLVMWLTMFMIETGMRHSGIRKMRIEQVTFLKACLLPTRLVGAVALTVVVARTMELSLIVRQAFSMVHISLLWAALFLFLWLCIDSLSYRGEQKMRTKKNIGGLSVVLFLRRCTKIALMVIAGILILDTIGVNVSAGLAALGIGGIAIALGAQKTVENFVGGVSIVLDQPIRVGDFCKIGTTYGTIESIGMRSTQIRTVERTLVTIPNGDLSALLIDNYTKRDKYLYRTHLALRYETTQQAMEQVLEHLREYLQSHSMIEQEAKPVAPRVRFLSFGDSALVVEVFAYVNTKDYSEFLAIQEAMNLHIAKLIESCGSGFAYPSQTLYLSKDSGVSNENTST